MLTEPIIDIIVYGFPNLIQFSLASNVYTKTDFNGHIHYYLNDVSTKIIPVSESYMRSGLFIKQNSSIYNNNDIVARNLLAIKDEANTSVLSSNRPRNILYIREETNINSLIDTRTYYDWLFEADETWDEKKDITNEEYIFASGDAFHIGILYNWQKDSDETWDDNPDITNQDYIQTIID